jgi:hypothetical protein
VNISRYDPCDIVGKLAYRSPKVSNCAGKNDSGFVAGL